MDSPELGLQLNVAAAISRKGSTGPVGGAAIHHLR